MIPMDEPDPYCSLVLSRLRDAHDTLHFQPQLQLLEGKTKRIDWEKIKKAGDELTRLKIIGMAAEIYDYAGKYDHARAVVEADGRLTENILRDESQLQSTKDKDRELLKQRVWILIHWGSTFYRAHNYVRARQLFSLCNETLGKWVITEEKPCSWTQARIYYCLGLVQRQIYDYKQARHWFTKSIELAGKSFVQRTHNITSEQPIYQRTKLFTDYYVAKLLALGMAWTYYTEGALDLAASLVDTARLLLTSTREVVIRSYIEILSASILAARGQRQKAIKLFQGAYDALKDHEAYRIRAANELAVAYVHEYFREPGEENLSNARKYINEVSESRDRRWQCNALVTESRLFRALGQYKEAEESATKALHLGEDQRFIRIDAGIARGEARLELNKINDACKDFTGALSDGLDNRKVQAVCHLHLARAYLLKHEHALALRHKDEANQHVGHVDNAFVRNLADTVETTIKTSAGTDLYVSISQTTMDPWEQEAKLHGFLTEWARRQPGNENEPWKVLGISKQTFYNWRAEKAKLNAETTKPKLAE